jgi:hypothetical protein
VAESVSRQTLMLACCRLVEFQEANAAPEPPEKRQIGGNITHYAYLSWNRKVPCSCYHTRCTLGLRTKNAASRDICECRRRAANRSRPSVCALADSASWPGVSNRLHQCTRGTGIALSSTCRRTAHALLISRHIHSTST